MKHFVIITGENYIKLLDNKLTPALTHASSQTTLE